MYSLQIVVLAAFLACFVSFFWAMSGGFFRLVGKTPFGTRIIQFVGTPLAILHLIALVRTRDVNVASALGSLALYTLSFVLFWSCVRVNRQKPLSLAFSLDHPEHLVVQGPYRYVRHPFYTSYTVAWIAGAIASQQLWLLLSVRIMCIIYYAAATVEERKFAQSPLAAEYSAYRARTGMFFPRLLVSKRVRCSEGERV